MSLPPSPRTPPSSFPWRYAQNDAVIAKQLANVSAAAQAASKPFGTEAAQKLARDFAVSGYASWANFRPAPNSTASVGQYQVDPQSHQDAHQGYTRQIAM